jgi:Fe2+ or Zn2+ uptake regulation protein
MTSVTQADLIERLTSHGLAVSAQRVAVLETIMNTSTGHSSADELYQQLHTQFPTLSRATVYSNLSVLAQAGLIEKLDTPDGARFGPEPSPHVNLVCGGCGSIEDVLVGDASLEALVERAANARGFEAGVLSLSISGRCASCR